MRVYVPSEAGLGARELAALRRLSRGSLALIADELQNPVSYSTVRRVLRAPDVEAAIARQVSAEIERAVVAIETVRYTGLGDDEWHDEMELADAGFGNFFKKIGKAIKNVAKKVVAVHKVVFNKVVRPVVKATVKVAKKTVEITKKAVTKVVQLHEKVAHQIARSAKQVGKAIKPFIPIILTVLGAVLAPFTGGASLLVAAALNAGYSIAMKAKQARAAKAANRAEAQALSAEVAAQTADLDRQLNDLFAQNPAVFAAAGITQSQWSAMTTEQKLAVVERINSGNMPSSQENATAAAEAQGQTPPTQTQTWQQAIQSSPVMTQWGEEAGDTDTSTAGIQTPTGVYDIYVEGRKVGSATTLSEASSILAQNSKPGDRVEMTLDGRSLGLKIVTAGGGVIAVPSDLSEQVRSASRDEVDGIIQRATQGAAATTTSSSGGGGFLAVLLVGGAVALAASGGHKR